jgi:hypothetical protein
MVHNIPDIFNGIVEVLVVLGVLAPVAHRWFVKEKAVTRNEHIKSALDFADMTVQTIGEANSHLTTNQRDTAIQALKKRLEANGLLSHFTDEEIASYVDTIAHYVDEKRYDNNGTN